VTTLGTFNEHERVAQERVLFPTWRAYAVLKAYRLNRAIRRRGEVRACILAVFAAA